MEKNKKKNIIKIATKKKTQKSKYPSAELLYSAALEDYNHVVSIYDRLYDRANIALTLCGVILVFFISNFDLSSLKKWDSYSCMDKMMIVLYLIFAGISVFFIVVSVIKLLLISCSNTIQTFDSNSIKNEELYNESKEDVALWIALQYIRGVNDVREKTLKKQKSFTCTIWFLIVSIVSYVISIILKTGGGF